MAAGHQNGFDQAPKGICGAPVDEVVEPCWLAVGAGVGFPPPPPPPLGSASGLNEPVGPAVGVGAHAPGPTTGMTPGVGPPAVGVAIGVPPVGLPAVGVPPVGVPAVGVGTGGVPVCAGGTAGLHTQMALFVHAPCVGIGSTHSQQGWRSEIVMADQNKSAHDRQPLLVGNTMFMCGASPLPSQSHIVLDHCNCGSPVIAIDIMRRWLEVARGQPFPDAAGDAAAALPEAAAAAAAAAPPAQKMHTCLR